MPGRASRSASRAAAFAVAEATNVSATLTDELLELVLGTLSLRSLRASALVCQRWRALSHPLLADGVKLMLARVLTNAKQREREQRSQLANFVLSPRPQVEEVDLGAAVAALLKVRSAKPDKHDYKRPLHLEMPQLGADVDESLECASATTYMLGGTLRVDGGGPTARERALRRAGGALKTAVGTLRLGAPDAPRTQLCCVDGHGRLFEWTTELPHHAATTPEKRVICLAEMSAPRAAWGEGLREWYEEPPFTDASKVLAYDVLLCCSGLYGGHIRNPGIFLPTPPHALPKDITRLAVFSYPDLTPISYFGDLRSYDGEYYGDRLACLNTSDLGGQDGREGRSLHRLESMSYHLPDDPPEPRTLPGEDGLGLEVWDDRSYRADGKEEEGEDFYERIFEDFDDNVPEGSLQSVNWTAGLVIERTRTVLGAAALGGNAAAIAALLAAGAEVEAKTNDSATALMFAAQGGHAAAIAALLAAGAEVDAKDNDGRTALEIAELCKHKHAARLLRGDAM